METESMRILLADDHVLVRKGIAKILEESFPDASFGEASDAAQTIDLLNKGEWNIILLDMSMPGRSGLDLIGDIKQLAPELPILVLSMYPAEQLAIRAIKAGASGYLTKDSVVNELDIAIRKIMNGKKYIPATIVELMADEIGRKNNSEEMIDLLSDREYQVFLMIAQGKRLTDIANELSLSIKTISTYRTHILQKLHIRDNVDITSYAIQRKLLV